MEDENSKANFLLVDAATPLVQTGLWQDGVWRHWTGSSEEAGTSLFKGTARILHEKEFSIDSLDGFYFCAGPGSMLGIRMAAMAIRGWQSLRRTPAPVFSYSSHTLLARILLARGTAPPFHVISDARRKRWNVTSVEGGHTIQALRRLLAEELTSLRGSFFRMEEIVRGNPPVSVREMVPYRLEGEAAQFLDRDWIHQSTTAEPLALEAPEYAKWTAERHR